VTATPASKPPAGRSLAVCLGSVANFTCNRTPRSTCHARRCRPRLAAFEAQLRAAGKLRRVCAGVQTNNPGAVRFWLHQGYAIVGGPELMPDGTTVYHVCKELAGDAVAA
jgi:hypothetical protein